MRGRAATKAKFTFACFTTPHFYAALYADVLVILCPSIFCPQIEFTSASCPFWVINGHFHAPERCPLKADISTRPGDDVSCQQRRPGTSWHHSDSLYAKLKKCGILLGSSLPGDVSTNLGWGKALMVALVWLAGMFVPLAARALLELPNWVAITWMIVWCWLGEDFLRLTECGNTIALRLRA